LKILIHHLRSRAIGGGISVSICWNKIVLLLGGLMSHALLMSNIGFSPSTFLLVLFLLRVIEPKPWWVAILVAFGISSFAYTLFTIWLEVQLPRGFLGF
jgi:hypothetical protein